MGRRNKKGKKVGTPRRHQTQTPIDVGSGTTKKMAREELESSKDSERKLRRTSLQIKIVDEPEEVPRKRGNEFEVTPIDVYSRLKYPLVLPPDIEDNDDDDTILLEFHPRKVFVSSLCLVCMEASKKICELCGMVSYCSSKHQSDDRSNHSRICQSLMAIHSTGCPPALIKTLSAESYRVHRLDSIQTIEEAMGRFLELWEREILLYPRVCRVCHVSTEDLDCCSACGIEFHCKEHEHEHESWCREYQVLREILRMQRKHGTAEPVIPNVIERSAEAPSLPEDLDRSIARLYELASDPFGSYYRDMDCYTYATLSHLATVPLTALYCMQRSCSNWRTITDFSIHVIGAELLFECADFRVWEKFFLHRLPCLRRLLLTFIGPELRFPVAAPFELLTNVGRCEDCKSSGRSVSVTLQPAMYYHQYARSVSFAKPDLACLFNPGIYRTTGCNGKDTWPATVKFLCDSKMPIAVTSYTECEMPRELARIRSIGEIDVILEYRRNPFASVRPDRNFVSDESAPLIYKNYYVTIVRGK